MKRVTERKLTYYRCYDNVPDDMIERVIEWFATSDNISFGWNICELDDFTRNWLQCNNEETDNTYHIAGCRTGGLSIVRFNFDTGYVTFLNNAAYT